MTDDRKCLVDYFKTLILIDARVSRYNRTNRGVGDEGISHSPGID